MLLKGVLSAIALCIGLVAGSASAAIVTYYGADDGAVPGGPDPTASAAQASFVTSAGAGSVITFEGLALGIPVGLTVAPGVTLTVGGNVGGGIVNTNMHTPTPIGFNTTSGGSEWLQMWPDFNSAGGATATFNFATAINAIGFFLTDTQVSFPGSITIGFNDGSVETLGLAKNSDLGGVLFFGFTDFGKSFNSLTINTGATGNTRDIWGIDDVRFVVAGTAPEPATLALLALGLAGLAATRRRNLN